MNSSCTCKSWFFEVLHIFDNFGTCLTINHTETHLMITAQAMTSTKTRNEFITGSLPVTGRELGADLQTGRLHPHQNLSSRLLRLCLFCIAVDWTLKTFKLWPSFLSISSQPIPFLTFLRRSKIRKRPTLLHLGPVGSKLVRHLAPGTTGATLSWLSIPWICLSISHIPFLESSFQPGMTAGKMPNKQALHHARTPVLTQTMWLSTTI